MRSFLRIGPIEAKIQRRHCRQRSLQILRHTLLGVCDVIEAVWQIDHPYEGFVANFRKKPFRLIEVADCRSRLGGEAEQPGNKVSLADRISFASKTRFFTVLWSCSITLLRYLHWRKMTRPVMTPSAFNTSTSAG
jgi:hypothetical protein